MNSNRHAEVEQESNAEITPLEKFQQITDSVEKAEVLLFDFKKIDSKDSIALFIEFRGQIATEEELRSHAKIWKLKSVRETAVSVKTKSQEIGDNFKVVTMTDQYPEEDSKWFIIGLYSINPSTNMTRMATYRVNRSTVDIYNIVEDSWSKAQD